MHDVFLSYSSKDKSAADAVCHALEAEGIRCWIAPRDVAGVALAQSKPRAIAAYQAAARQGELHAQERLKRLNQSW